jgi:hypothetical protein
MNKEVSGASTKVRGRRVREKRIKKLGESQEGDYRNLYRISFCSF